MGMAREGYLGRYLIGRLLVASGLSGRWTFSRGDYRLHFYPSALTLTLWAAPRDRQGDEEFLRGWLQPGDDYVDVGANIGALALVAAARVGRDGTVVAIEAHPRTYGYLVGNVQLNEAHSISTVQAAVGDRDGSVYFSDSVADDQNAVSSDPTLLTVPLRTLDDLVPGDGIIALLKVDVEGYERFVFEGASAVLTRTRAVYFEAWEHHFHRHGYTTGDVVALLAGHGFTTYRLMPEGVEMVDSSFRATCCLNLVAVRPEEAGRLRRVWGEAAASPVASGPS